VLGVRDSIQGKEKEEMRKENRWEVSYREEQDQGGSSLNTGLGSTTAVERRGAGRCLQ